MNIPKKAIIALPTYAEAERLNAFLRKHTDLIVCADRVNDFRGDAYCDLAGLNVDKSVCIASRDNYLTWIQASERDPIRWDFIPENPALRFISVDDFIAISMSDEIVEDAEISLEALL